MSAVLTRSRRTSRARDGEPYRQTSLFGQVVAPPPREASEDEVRAARGADAPVAEPEAPVVTGTLDEAISGLWTSLLATEPSDCPLCGDELVPQRSGDGGVIGGRCRSCATTLV